MRLRNVIPPNPFKVGDRVIYIPFQDNVPYTVTEIKGDWVLCRGLWSDIHINFRKVNF